MFSIAGVFLKLNGELVPPTDHETSLRKSLKHINKRGSEFLKGLLCISAACV